MIVPVPGKPMIWCMVQDYNLRIGLSSCTDCSFLVNGVYVVGLLSFVFIYKIVCREGEKLKRDFWGFFSFYVRH
jgi:hypothetical protein